MLCSITGLLKAQQQDTMFIMNGGFENWDTIGDYSQPSFWYSLNSLTEFGYDPTTLLTTDAHSGKYAVRLEGNSGPSGNLSGLLVSGPVLDAQFNVNLSTGKFRFTSRPSSLRFYYKAFPANSDSSQAGMILTKKNKLSGMIDTIASARIVMKDSVKTYTLADLKFDYRSSEIPDSAFIVASSSYDGFDPKVGSVLIIDDMELIYLNGIAENTNNSHPVIYPNPSTGMVNIQLNDGENLSLEVFDQAGRLVYHSVLQQQQNTLNLEMLNPGLYLISLHNQLGEYSYSKIILTK